MSVNTLQGQRNVNSVADVENNVFLLGNANPTSSLTGIYNVYKVGNAHTASLLQGSIGDVSIVINDLETYVNLVGTYDLKLLIFADNTKIPSDRTIITIDRT